MKALAERLVVPMGAGLHGVAGGGCVWAASAVLPTCATLNCKQHSLHFCVELHADFLDHC